MDSPIPQMGLGPNHEIQEKDIRDSEIADNVGLKWKDLARALDNKEATIEEIEKEKGPSTKECCIQLLVRWQRREGKNATAGKLTEVLKKIKLKNLAENLTNGTSRCQRNCCKKPASVEEISLDESKDSNDPNHPKKCEKLISEMSDQLTSLKEEVSKMTIGIKELEDECSTLKQKCYETEQEASILRNRNKELETELSFAKQKAEEEISSLRAKIKELEDATQQLTLADFPNPIGEVLDVSKDSDARVRETQIIEQLNKLKGKLDEYVTKPLEVPVVNQDQLKTPVKLQLLLRLTESLQMIYSRILTMVTETCKCSEDLRREFYDFVYHGLRAEHNELTHRVEDLESALPEMSEDEKREFVKLKRYQDNQQRQVERLDRLWKGLFSPPERLPEAPRSLPNGGHHNDDKLTKSKKEKVSRHTDPGVKPKQANPRDQASSSGMPSTSDDAKYEVQFNTTTRKSFGGLFKKKEEKDACVLTSCSTRRDS